ncbi:MAG: hypothetical protein PF450_15605, partial [Bacteroidales bacterium]|nr:hypothetical protein [Bacteroidales bacterium]
EDEGFSYVSVSNESKVKKFIDSKKEGDSEINYTALNQYWSPPVWTPAAHSGMYGQTIRSAYVSRRGDGGNKAVWTAVLKDPGFYDVYVYIPVTAMYRPFSGRSRGGGGQNGGPQGDRQQGGGQQGGRERRGPELVDKGTNYLYTVSSNEGTEEVEFKIDRPEDGWNKLGTFHFPADTAKIELTNNTNGSRVIADAVKWEKRD